jgi:hypothetical protein
LDCFYVFILKINFKKLKIIILMYLNNCYYILKNHDLARNHRISEVWFSNHQISTKGCSRVTITWGIWFDTEVCRPSQQSQEQNGCLCVTIWSPSPFQILHGDVLYLCSITLFMKFFKLWCIIGVERIFYQMNN